jgi:hydrogenase maturation factor
MFVIDKQATVENVIRLPIDDEVKDLVTETVVKSFVRKKRAVTYPLQQSSPMITLLYASQGNTFCEQAEKIARQYWETLRSRSALVIFVRFLRTSSEHVGIYQFGSAAVFAFLPQRKELKVIRDAFSKIEKSAVYPSVISDKDAFIFQRVNAEYFRRFLAVNSPPTPEEALEQSIKEKGINSLGSLLAICDEIPAAKQAKIKVEMGGIVAKIRLDQVREILSRKEMSYILLKVGAGASVKVGSTRLTVDAEGLPEFKELLSRLGLD